MKSIYIIFLYLFIPVVSHAQCPLLFNYQAIVRDAAGNAVGNQNITFRFTILDSLNTGAPLYRETQHLATNMFAGVATHIGGGTPVTGSMQNINWSTRNKYMDVEIDPAGGTNFLNMGTEQWGSVPYVLFADSCRKGGFPQHYIGEYYGGGIVFYVSDNGLHGLIADSTDLQTDSTSAWAPDTTHLLNAPFTGLAGGAINTERIINKLGAGNFAAQSCANYTGGGFGDWYLPSTAELNLLYQQQLVAGLSSNASYWSSTESSATQAVTVNFASGSAVPVSKSAAANVRAIRAF